LPSVRGLALLQSCPTAYTSDPAEVVVNETDAVVEVPELPELAPVPPDPLKATIVKDWL
jgi:hypothetical protein